MSQFDFGTLDPTVVNGTVLAADLNSWRTALHSGHRGSTRPTYAIAGTEWINDAVNPWVVYKFDGTDDISIGTINTTTNIFTPQVGALSGVIKSTAGVPSVATAGTDYTAPNNVQVQSATRFAVGGTSDAITGTLSPAIVSYVAGLRVTTTIGSANTLTNPTINLNALGIKTIKKRDTSGAKVALVAGDYNASGPFDFEYDGTDFILLNPLLAVSNTSKIQSITASVGSNALTLTLNTTSLDFRSSTLSSGTINTRIVPSPISITVSSGSTLGTSNAIAARLAILAIDNAGTVVLAVTNTAGGINLDETTLISTTAEGGAGAADSASVIYSSASLISVPFRVVGFIDITESIAGAWVSNPSVVQGAGGQSMLSLGYGQTFQDLTASRSLGTTYYNTTGNKIMVIHSGFGSVGGNSWWADVTVNSSIIGRYGGFGTGYNSFSFIIPAGASYSVSNTLNVSQYKWEELR